MADDVEDPSGAESEPDDPQAVDTDVTDLPLEESPEAHIRRAMAGGDEGALDPEDPSGADD